MIDLSLRDVANEFFTGPSVPGNINTATSRLNVGPTVEAGQGTAPDNPLNQVAGAGRGYVNPKYVLKKEPVAPVADTAAYNASIAQQESGGRPDIGFHDKSKSSAFGPHGLTTAAYTDARRINPNLPADITQANAQQLNEAQNAFTGANAGYLKNYGIEVNPNTLSAAHFAGAKGLNDFMTKKDEQGRPYISPAAQAANGGYDKTRAIIEKRLAGQAAPASGAAQAQTAPVSPEQAAAQTAQTAPTPAPATEAYTGQGLSIGGMNQQQLEQQKQYQVALNSNSAEQLGKVAFDLNTPRDVASAAFDKLHNTMAVQKGMERAQQVMTSLGDSPTPAALNKAMNNKDTGSYFKVLMYQALGWVTKAQQELDKIDPPTVYKGTVLNTGQNYNVKYHKNTNEVLAAWDAQGKPVTDRATLGSIAAQGGSGEYDIVGGTFINDTTGEVGTVYRNKRNPSDSFVQTETGRKSLTGFRPQSSTGSLDAQRVAQLQKTNIDLAADWVKLQNKVRGAAPEAANKYLGEFNSKYQQNFPLQSLNGPAPQIDVTTGRMMARPAALQEAPPQAAPAPAPQAPPAIGAVPPQAAAAPAPAPAAGAVSPQATVPAPATQGKTPAQIQAEADAAATRAKEEAQEVGQDIGKARVNQGKNEANADYLITKVKELTAHPGFKFSVGVPDIGERTLGVGIPVPFGATIAAKIPGTDVNDWAARFKEIQGRSFLEAIENLRGLGALSNLEGESATKAIQRMNTSQSEKEFKEAAKDFEETIQRGIDRTRTKLGQEPKYGIKPESETAKRTEAAPKKLSREEQQAVEWVRNNPNDPRTPEIKRRLGL
jgi:hypothetical protein